jgi:hypothetical protein
MLHSELARTNFRVDLCSLTGRVKMGHVQSNSFQEVWGVSDKTLAKHMNFVSPTGQYIDVRLSLNDCGGEYITITVDECEDSFASIIIPRKDFYMLLEALNKV